MAARALVMSVGSTPSPAISFFCDQYAETHRAKVSTSPLSTAGWIASAFETCATVQGYAKHRQDGQEG